MLQTQMSQYVRCSSLPIGWRRNWHLSLNYLVRRAQPKLPAFSVCLLFSTAVYGLRKSQSGGQLKVCWFIFPVMLRCCGKKTTERFILCVGQFEHVDIISHLHLIEGGLHFFFLLCWNLKEASTSSHTDKIFSSAGITVYERWIVSIPGKHLECSLVKRFKWISGWFSNYGFDFPRESTVSA